MTATLKTSSSAKTSTIIYRLDKTCESPVSPPGSPRSRELSLCRHLRFQNDRRSPYRPSRTRPAAVAASVGECPSELPGGRYRRTGVLIKFPGLTAQHLPKDLACDQSELFHSHRSASMLGLAFTRVPAGILEPRPIAKSFARATLRGRRDPFGGNHAVIIRRVAASFLSTIGPGS